MKTATIFDPLRKKEVALTPEEEVRQNIISWLNTEYHIPMSLMMSEYAFKFNGLIYRSDIVIFNKVPKPVMLVECKAPDIKITHTVIEQGLRYNKVLKVKFMLFTNGTQTYLCEYDSSQDKFTFINKIPDYKEIIK